MIRKRPPAHSVGVGAGFCEKIMLNNELNA
jgi:hypothetical protein